MLLVMKRPSLSSEAISPRKQPVWATMLRIKTAASFRIQSGISESISASTLAFVIGVAHEPKGAGLGNTVGVGVAVGVAGISGLGTAGPNAPESRNESKSAVILASREG